MTQELPKTFQMRFDLSNEEDVRIARFLQEYPWSKTQKVKEVLLMYIEGQLVPNINLILPKTRSIEEAGQSFESK
jgi:hypothetical protein